MNEGDTGTCRWEQCRKPIMVMRRVQLTDSEDLLEWVHVNKEANAPSAPTRSCPGWAPTAEPLEL